MAVLGDTLVTPSGQSTEVQGQLSDSSWSYRGSVLGRQQGQPTIATEATKPVKAGTPAVLQCSRSGSKAAEWPNSQIPTSQMTSGD